MSVINKLLVTGTLKHSFVDHYPIDVHEYAKELVCLLQKHAGIDKNSDGQTDEQSNGRQK